MDLLLNMVREILRFTFSAFKDRLKELLQTFVAATILRFANPVNRLIPCLAKSAKWLWNSIRTRMAAVVGYEIMKNLNDRFRNVTIHDVIKN